MILYNTTFLVEDAVLDDFIKWVKDDHLPTCEDLSLLEGQKFFKLLHNEEDGAGTYCIQYFLSSDVAYNKFVNEDDYEIKRSLTKLFGQQIVFFSSTMKEL